MTDNVSANQSEHHQPHYGNQHHAPLYLVQTGKDFLTRTDRGDRPSRRLDGCIKHVRERVVVMQHLHTPSACQHVAPDFLRSRVLHGLGSGKDGLMQDTFRTMMDNVGSLPANHQIVRTRIRAYSVHQLGQPCQRDVCRKDAVHAVIGIIERLGISRHEHLPSSGVVVRFAPMRLSGLHRAGEPLLFAVIVAFGSQLSPTDIPIGVLEHIG